MQFRQTSRSARAKHAVLGTFAGAAIVIAIASLAQARLQREKERTAEALAEVQRHAEIAESNNRRIAELQAKVSSAEQKLAEMNQNETTRKAEARRLRADLQKAERNESELNRLRDELDDLERKDHLYFPEPRIPEAKGKIKSIEENLAVIDLGSQDGLKAGMLLQVHRTTPQPQYLGTLTIQRAESHRAVGLFKPVSKDASIQVGDIVDMKVLR